MKEVLLISPTCANWTPNSTVCLGKGTLACAHCKLVVVSYPSTVLYQISCLVSNAGVKYCGAACQRDHWSEHKKTCKSPLTKKNWRPQWDLENREPAWATGSASRNWHNTFGENKYLWGNVPAIDVLRLDHNEGHGYQHGLSLLFAGVSHSPPLADLANTR